MNVKIMVQRVITFDIKMCIFQSGEMEMIGREE